MPVVVAGDDGSGDKGGNVADVAGNGACAVGGNDGCAGNDGAADDGFDGVGSTPGRVDGVSEGVFASAPGGRGCGTVDATTDACGIRAGTGLGAILTRPGQASGGGRGASVGRTIDWTGDRRGVVGGAEGYLVLGRSAGAPAEICGWG